MPIISKIIFFFVVVKLILKIVLRILIRHLLTNLNIYNYESYKIRVDYSCYRCYWQRSSWCCISKLILMNKFVYRLVRPCNFADTSRFGHPIIGELYMDRYDFDNGLFTYIESAYICDTLEPPLRSSGSFVPCGKYSLAFTYSPKFRTKLPLLKDVPHRSGIRIHAGNTVKDTLGCILVGRAFNGHLVGSRGYLADVIQNLKDFNITSIEITDSELPF